MHARMQGVENSEIGYVPARQTTLIHRGARKVDGDSMARTLTQIRCVQTPQHGRAHAGGLCHLRTISTDARTYGSHNLPYTQKHTLYERRLQQGTLRTIRMHFQRLGGARGVGA